MIPISGVSFYFFMCHLHVALVWSYPTVSFMSLNLYQKDTNEKIIKIEKHKVLFYFRHFSYENWNQVVLGFLKIFVL